MQMKLPTMRRPAALSLTATVLLIGSIERDVKCSGHKADSGPNSEQSTYTYTSLRPEPNVRQP